MISNDLIQFVNTMCEGRDWSHGFEHMVRVTENAINIFDKEKKNINEELWDEIDEKIKIVAMLHDVADHKYDSNGELRIKVRKFVETIHSDVDGIMKTIDLISYSKEQRGIDCGVLINFESELGVVNVIVRNIVSDSDKLEALGKIGLDRCSEYNKKIYFEKFGKEMDYHDLKRDVMQHCNEKLLRLKDNFIRTSSGKEMAVILHDELVKEMEKF